MRQVTSRAVAQAVNHNVATEWSMALWAMALAFLLATFQVY